MALDILGYRDKWKKFYGDKPLEDVARDAYKRGGYDKQYPDFDTWKKESGIDADILADNEKRNPIKTAPLRLAKSFLEGGARGLTTELPSMVGGAIEFAGSHLPGKAIEETGKTIKDWADEKATEWYGPEKERTGLDRIVYEGTKMLAPSIVPGGIVLKGARAAKGIDALLKAGKIAEATKAASAASNIASGSVAGLFGLSQAQQTRDTANQQADQLEAQGDLEGARKAREAGQGFAPLAAGAIEAAGEFLGTKYLGKLFGLDEAAIAKRGTKEFAKDLLKTLGVEVGTEMGQASGESAVEKYSGIRPDAAPLEEAIDVIGPTVFMTLLTGGLAGAANKLRSSDPREKEGAEALEKQKQGALLSLTIYNGLKTGQHEGKPFTGDDALQLMRDGRKKGILSNEDIQRFHEFYPGLKKEITKEFYPDLYAKEQTKNAYISMIDTGIMTGQYDNTPIERGDIVAIASEGYKQGLFTSSELDDFSKKYPGMKADFQELYINSVIDKVNETIQKPQMPLDDVPEHIGIPPEGGVDLNGTLQTETEITNVAPTADLTAQDSIKGPESAAGIDFPKVEFPDNISASELNTTWDDLYSRVQALEEKNAPIIDSLKREMAAIPKGDRSGRKAEINKQIASLKEAVVAETGRIETAFREATDDYTQRIKKRVADEGLDVDEDEINETINMLSDGRSHDNGGNTWTMPVVNQVLDELRASVAEREAKAVPAETKGNLSKAAMKYENGDFKRWEDKESRIEFELNPPNISANMSDYWEAGIRHKGWAQEAKKFKTKEEALKWLDEYDTGKIDKEGWGPGAQFLDEMFGKGAYEKVKERVTSDNEAVVKEAIADAKKNGPSNEFRALFGGIDPVKADTTNEAVAALAKKLGLKWEAPATKEEPTKAKPAPKPKVAQNMITRIKQMGGIKFSEDYNTKWLKEDGDAKRLLNNTHGLSPDAIASQLIQEGYPIESADHMIELIKTGEGRKIYNPELSDKLLNRDIERAENEWIEEQLINLKEEGIDAGAISESEEELKDVSISEIAAEEELSESEIAFAEKDAADFFEAVAAKPKGDVQPNLEGLSPEETFELSNDTTEWSKPLPKQPQQKNNDLFNNEPPGGGPEAAAKALGDREKLSTDPKTGKVQPQDGWEDHLIKARVYALNLGIQEKVKDWGSLESIVKAIKEHLEGTEQKAKVVGDALTGDEFDAIAAQAMAEVEGEKPPAQPITNRELTIRDLGDVGTKVQFATGFNKDVFTIYEINQDGMVSIGKGQPFRRSSEFKKAEAGELPTGISQREMAAIRAQIKQLKALGADTTGYDEWVKIAESGNVDAISKEPGARDTLKAINLSIAEQKRRLKDEAPAAGAEGKGFKVGDRVVMKNGRHGEIVSDDSYTMRSYTFGTGASSTTKTIRFGIKSDAGAMFKMYDPAELTPEIDRPGNVVPDILSPVDNEYEEPDRLLYRISLYRRDERNHRAAAQRARKQENVNAQLKIAEKAKSNADKMQAAFDEWAAKYPEEAKKNQPEPAIAPAAKAATGQDLSSFGLRVTKSQTKTGKTAWEVTGNTKEHMAILKAAGGRWYGPKKAWSFYNADPTNDLLARLGVAAKPAEASAPFFKETGVDMKDGKLVPHEHKPSLANAAAEAGKGIDATYDALAALFKAKAKETRGTMSGLDSDLYAAVKPLFAEAYQHFKAAGREVKDWIVEVISQLKARGIAPADSMPYVKHFYMNDMKTLTNGEGIDKINLTGGIENATISNAPETKGTPSDDRAGVEGQSAQDLSGTESSGQAQGVRSESGRADDGELSESLVGSDDGNGNVESEQPDGKTSSADDGRKPGVGGNAGNLPGVRRPRTGNDHVIEPGAIDRSGSWLNTAKTNLDIIELAKKLDAEGRMATPDEQELLAKYTGFGASELANKLFPGYSHNREIYPNWESDAKWREQIERLVKLLTPEEIASAARSTQYAHYTSPKIINSIYKALERFGFKGGKMLEPGMGVGSFFGLMPSSMRNTSIYTGIEFDAITAKIAKHLYPNQNILAADYTKQKLPNGFFDIAIGNPPFSSIKILTDPDYKKLRLSLHDYFFVKSLDKVRPGGLLVFITSRYTMDKQDSRVRKILNEKADLLGAIRLPQTAFKQNAGTEVVTDVIFLRKKVPGETSTGMEWENTSPVTTENGEFPVNEYYTQHPEMVLGKHSSQGKMYKANEYTVLPLEGDIEEAFEKAAGNLPENVYSIVKAPAEHQKAAVIEHDFDPANKKEGGTYLSDKGEVMITESGRGVPIHAVFPKITPAEKEWLKDYVGLRDALKTAQYDQLNEGEWEKSLDKLRKSYKAFVKKHGRILEFKTSERKTTDEDGNEQIIEYRKYKNDKVLTYDVESPLVTGLDVISEDGVISDAPVLKDRTILKPTVPEITNVPDALAVSLNEIGSLDIDHIASLMGRPRQEIIDQLGDLIYELPEKDGNYVLADEYLSGNVVDKLDEAKAAAKIDPKYARNVEALQNAQPEPLPAHQITANAGVTWIPLKYYNDFVQDVLGLRHREVHYNPAGNIWTIIGGMRQGQRGAASEWSTQGRGANEIFDAVLNNSTIRVNMSISDGAGGSKTVLDPAETAAANDVAKRMRKRFKSWVWEDASRASELLEIYNKTKNTIVPRKFDGKHLTLPGVSLRYSLLPHQKNAIWRIIQSGNTYIYHAVGAGKTYEMVAAGMEQRRLGLIKKPLYVVPNHMLRQFSNEFQELYPMAHIMVADETNFHTTNRKRFMAQAALNNPDAIVITHSAFGLLKMKEENIQPVRDRIIAELQDSLAELEEDKSINRIKIKQMEKRIEQVGQRFDSMVAGGDNVLTFEDMGVDFMFVDEAHQFRKLDFTTNRQAKGIDPNGSRRAMDLYIKTKWLSSVTPHRSHVFASGTPVTNTMGELYTVMKFFMEDEMEREGIHYFDSWANEHGEMSTAPEMNAAGRYEMVERFAKFVNMPELMSRVRTFMDVLTNSQLGGFVNRPKIIGGKPNIVVTPALPSLKNYQDNVLLPRIETSKAWKPTKEQPGNPDPLINIITDGRLASIDLRFVQRGAANDPDSKLNQYIDKIISLYQESKDNVYMEGEKESPIKGGAIIAFYNHGFGQSVAAHRGFDARAWMMGQFKKAGIKASEVAWIDDYDTAAKKEAMFKEMRNGHKRILIGSAKKMGTGMNVQNRLANLVYLDPPWYPSDVEQPLGRIIRQGNQNKEVGVYYFATKGSYDATMWQMVQRKASFQEDAFSGAGTRSMEDISATSLYEMAAALASGDERAIRLAGLSADIDNLENLRVAHHNSQNALKNDKNNIKYWIPNIRAKIADLKEADEKVEYIGRAIDAKSGTRTFTERKEFGEALIEKMLERINADEEITVQIGSISGFPVLAKLVRGLPRIEFADGKSTEIPGAIQNGIVVRITDKVSYNAASDIFSGTDPVGLVTKIINKINGVSADVRKAEDELAEREDELKKINARLGAPFEFAQELNEMIAEANQIKRELEEESNETPQAPQAPTGPNAEMIKHLQDNIKELNAHLINETKGSAEYNALIQVRKGFEAEINRLMNPRNEDAGEDDTTDYQLVQDDLDQYRVDAWHGSPHTFDKFSGERIGSGEGNQAYGYGLYFAGAKEVAEYYKDYVYDKFYFRDVNKRLSQLDKQMQEFRAPGGDGKFTDIRGYELKAEYDKLMNEKLAKKGRLYKVELAPDEDEFLLWDRPVGEQSDKVKAALAKAGYEEGSLETGEQIYSQLMMMAGHGIGWAKDPSIRDKRADQAASDYLHSLGIRGIQYVNGDNRDGMSQIQASIDRALEQYQHAIKAGNTEAAERWNQRYDELKAKLEGAYNYVIFSDKDVEIKERYALRNNAARTMPTLADVQEIFKGQKVTQSSNGLFLIETRGGRYAVIESVESITPDSASLRVGYGSDKLKDGDFIAGSYRKGTIKLAKGRSDKWTLAHESTHFMEDMGVIDKLDIATLRGHIKRLVRDGQFKTKNQNDIGGKEDRAEFIAAALLSPPKGTIGRIIERIQDFIDQLVRAFTGKRTARGVVRDVKSGAIYNRPAAAQGAGRSYNVATMAEPFYSQLLNTVTTKLKEMPSKIQSIPKWLERNQVKPAEMKWMGVQQWLKENAKDGAIDKQKFADFLKANQIEIQEIEKGAVSESEIDIFLNDEAGEGFTREEAREYLENDEGRTQFSQHVMPGGENYKELLLTLPVKKVLGATQDIIDKASDDIREVLARNNELTEEAEDVINKWWENPTEENSKEVYDITGEDTDIYTKSSHVLANVKNQYKSAHWDEPNVLAHVRMNDRIILTYTPEQIKNIGQRIITALGKGTFDRLPTMESLASGAPDAAVAKKAITPLEAAQFSHYKGFRFNNQDGATARVLFIEEVQSDWHQEGKKKGYAKPYENVVSKVQKNEEGLWEALDKNGDNIWTESFKGQYDTKETAYNRAEWYFRTKNPENRGVPAAPFAENWHEMVMKRMLRYAAENGYDKIAWTTGEQQAERYDLSKQLSEVRIKRHFNTITRSFLYQIGFTTENGDKHTDQTWHRPEKLPDIVGKDLANTIINTNKDEMSFTGLDLKVGGEGMKSFYDNLIPGFMRKYVAQWGAKIGESVINTKPFKVDEKNDRIQLAETETVPSVDITPQMKHDVLFKGQAYYSVKEHQDPPASKDPKVLNQYLKDETDAIVQTIMNKLHPKQMTWLETMLKSPEWFGHPAVQRIVSLFVRDRNELYHETFNHLNLADDIDAPENTVTEAGNALKGKGLSIADRITGKESAEYKMLARFIDHFDTSWKKDKNKTLAENMKACEDYMKKNGATEDVIKVWRLYRESYDKALVLLTRQMEELISRLKEQASFRGEEADVAELQQTLKFALAEMKQWEGFYAPRLREAGDWAVRAYKEHGPLAENREYYREHRGSELSAQRLAKKLAREGWKIASIGKVQKLPETVYQDVKAASAAKLIESAMSKLTGKDNAVVQFNQDVLQTVADEIRARGFRSSMIHRKQGEVIRGYIEDPVKRHLLYINNMSGGVSKAQVARMAMEELLGQQVMGKQVGGIDPVKDPEAYKTATNYIEEQLRNLDNSDRIIGLAKSIATFKFLGFNIRSLAVNMTALVTTAPAAIHQYAMGGKGSFAAIFKELGVAGKDFGGYMAGRKLQNMEEQAFLDDMRRKGWDDPQYTRDALGTIAKTHSRVWSTAMNSSMYLFGKSEQFNRGATILAAYRLARKQGLTVGDAKERAKDATDKAHAVYGKATMPMWAQGTNPAAKIGQMLYVYGKFSHNYLQMLYDMGLKKHNIKGAMFAFLSPLVVAGGAALPFKGAIFGLAGAILSLLGWDDDPEKWVWDQIREHLGTGAETVARHGLTGAAGVDISGSLSIGVGIPKNIMDLSGAIGGSLETFATAFDAARSGSASKAIEAALPTGLANPIKAYRESNEGISTKRNYPVWDESGKQLMPTGGESVQKAVGFRSARQAVLSERTWEGKQQQTDYQEKRNALYQRYRSFILSGGKDRAKYMKFVVDVREYNKKVRDAGLINMVPMITSESLRAQMRRMDQPTKRERAILTP